MGLRVWKATTLFQPRSAISFRIEVAVRKVSGKSASKYEKFSTWMGPEMTVLPTELKAFTPGCSMSVVR